MGRCEKIWLSGNSGRVYCILPSNVIFYLTCLHTFSFGALFLELKKEDLVVPWRVKNSGSKSGKDILTVTCNRDGYAYYHKGYNPQEPHFTCRTDKYSESFMVWGSFSGRRLGKLVAMPAKVNHNFYLLTGHLGRDLQYFHWYTRVECTICYPTLKSAGSWEDTSNQDSIPIHHDWHTKKLNNTKIF